MAISISDRPAPEIRQDRLARYKEECEQNIRHCRKTISLNFRSCEERFKRLQTAPATEAVKLAAELYGCRQFVVGVITGRLHKMEEPAVQVLQREWEEMWDKAFGDLVGRTLKMQD